MNRSSPPSEHPASGILPSHIEALAGELGAVAARIERDIQARFDAMKAELMADTRAELSAMRANGAELELRAMKAEKALADMVGARLATVRDGVDGAAGASVADLAPVIADEVAKAVAAVPVPKNGRDGSDADPEVTKAMVDEAVAAAIPQVFDLVQRTVDDAVSRIPPAAPGKDADPEVIRAVVAEAVATLPPAHAGEKGERGDPGRDGRLPIVKAWAEAVHYEGAVVTHDGATWQAQRDTGRAPPHDDWICLAAAGQDGLDGRSFTVRGTWVADTEYASLDVVALGGAAFVARRDNPGECPGEGWQLMSAQGKRGKEGEPGRRGEPGQAGPAVVSAEVDENGLLILRNADGSVVRCDFYDLLSRLG